MKQVILLIVGTLIIVITILLWKFYFHFPDATKDAFVERTKSMEKRVILIEEMNEEQLYDAIDEFIGMYKEDMDTSSLEKPFVTRYEKGFLLTFSANIDYNLFCFWVNYLVYSDKKKQERYFVYGWYPFGEVESQKESMNFSGKTIMIYIPKEDDEFDNVYIITPDNQYYKNEFAGTTKAIPPCKEQYRPKP